MNEKPILLSTEMVAATLDDRKTQTRRVIKPQFIQFANYHVNTRTPAANKDGTYTVITNEGISGTHFAHIKPSYKPGDILWVRETWCKEFYAPIGESESVTEFLNKIEFRICYKATDALPDNCSWKPSIHMPRAAARIFLRVTNVRVERLNQINYGDCCAEGVYNKSDLISVAHGSVATDKFRELWDSLYAKREDCSWDDNPWVWVYVFERIIDLR
jgi:hypothetical protein